MVIVFLIKKMVYFWIETTNVIQMKKNFSISEIDQNIAVVEDSQSNGSTFLDDFVYGGGSEFMLPINNTSSTGFPTFFDDSVVQQQSACTVYQNQSDAEWMGDYQMCDGTWQYGGYIGAGATVCLVSGTAFTLSGMDLVPLYPCGDSEPPIYQKPFPQPPSYGEPQTIEMPVEPQCTMYQNQSSAIWKGDMQFCDGSWQYYGEGYVSEVASGGKICLRTGGFRTAVGFDLVPLYACDGSETPIPTEPIEMPYFPQPPSYGEPQTIEMPIEQPIEMPVEPQPIYGQAIPETTFIDDNTFRIITELPAMPQITAPVMERMPMAQPVDQFISGTALVTCPDGTTDIANGIVEPCIGHDKVPAASTPPSTPTALPTKPVSKNLTPYIYAGLGIIVILVVARMVTKK
jgi:hypothetical protein